MWAAQECGGIRRRQRKEAEPTGGVIRTEIRMLMYVQTRVGLESKLEGLDPQRTPPTNKQGAALAPFYIDPSLARPSHI